MDAFKWKKPNAGFLPDLTRRLVFNRLPKVSIFITSLLLALSLINCSIEAIGPQTLVIGDRKPFEYTNKLRIKGMDFNRSSLMGTDNYYNLDYVIYGRPKTSLLKVAVGSTYEFGQWTSESTVQFPYTNQSIPLSVTGWETVQEKELTVLPLIYFDGYIPSPSNPTALTLLKFNYSNGRGNYIEKEMAGCRYDDTIGLFWTENEIESWSKYVIRYYTIVYSENYTLVTGVHGDSRYLEVPENVAEKIEVKTHYATEGAVTDIEKVNGIIDYLQENYGYNIVWRDAPHDQDPVIWFLFNEGKGISIHFNSALVLMARTLGIPSRVVGGYRMTTAEANFLSPMDRVVQAEVWCEGIGWVRFDATPAPVLELREPSRRTWIRISGKDKEEEKEPGENHPLRFIAVALVALTGLLVIAYMIDSFVSRKVEESEPDEGFKEFLDDRLKIRFTEIDEGYPNVWERDTPRTLFVTSSIRGDLTLKIGEKELTFPSFTENIEHVQSFSIGEYLIKASLDVEKTGSVIESSVVLRVVEYKLEIVSLFNQILKNPTLAMQWWRLTAREIQTILISDYPGLPEGVLERFASLFEFADYSLQPIGRREYLRFYEAKRELEEWISGREEG